MQASLYQPNTSGSLPRGNGLQSAARILNAQPPAATAQTSAAAERETQIRIGRLQASVDHLRAELAAVERQKTVLRAELQHLQVGALSSGTAAWAAAHPVSTSRDSHVTPSASRQTSSSPATSAWAKAYPIPQR